MDRIDALPPVLAMFLAEPRLIVLVGLLALAVVVDMRALRLPSWLTVGGVVLGLVLSLVPDVGPGPVFFKALGGAATGLAVLLPLYVMRFMGGGDLKLMAAVGAFVGPINVLLVVPLTFIAGGLFALAWAVWHHSLSSLRMNLHAALYAQPGTQAALLRLSSTGRLPYAIAIGTGTVAWIVLHALP